jgi:hypothetical protein
VLHCHDLIAEARRRGWAPNRVWEERDALAELDVMHERARLIADASSSIVLHGDELAPDLRSWIRDLLERSLLEPRLWGTAAIPSFVLRFWAFRRLDATLLAEGALATTLAAILAAGERRGGMEPLASPYNDFTDCYAFATGALHLTTRVSRTTRSTDARGSPGRCS